MKNGARNALVGFVDRHLVRTGLVVGSLLFSLSLTPSLLPRTALIQGLLSGTSFAAGYAVGVSLQWIWNYTELKIPWSNNARWFNALLGVVCATIALGCLSQMAFWQNAVRQAMGVAPVEGSHPIVVLLVSLVPAVTLILLGSLLVHSVRILSHRMMRYLPRRVALVLGFAVVGLATGVVFNGIILRAVLHAADDFFEQLDTVAGQFGEPPANPLRSGSLESLVAWNTLGRGGRVYLESGPDQQDIEEIIGRPAKEPLRVYVGLRSAESIEKRALLALAELVRIGAFERSVLVVIMPVGTGWVDPPGIDSLEYLMAGDVASVALQYSYLSSPLSLIIEPDYGSDAARALFSSVYNYWTALPHDNRPRLYLNGLSLGAHSSQASAQLLDLLGDPYDGALWVGPPYTSPIWRWATATRDVSSPLWRPRFGNGSSIRFANRGIQLEEPDGAWGPVRIAFLQYPSDPIVFFDWSILYSEPAWMRGERGPGVSPALSWYPVVTLLQIGMDMALAQTSPVGYGHIYAVEDYIDAWRILVEPPGWSDAAIQDLKVRISTGSVGKL